MKRAGLLDHRIAIQRMTRSYDPSGEPIEIWTTLGNRWADLRPLSGLEVNAAEQWIAREQTEFTLRWDSSLEDLSPLDRIVFPFSDASASPEITRSIYNIISVHQLGRNEDIKVVGARLVG